MITITFYRRFPTFFQIKIQENKKKIKILKLIPIILDTAPNLTSIIRKEHFFNVIIRPFHTIKSFVDTVTSNLTFQIINSI